jgi:hypothetical protein
LDRGTIPQQIELAHKTLDSLLFHELQALAGRNVIHLVGPNEGLLRGTFSPSQTFNVSIGGITFGALLSSGLSNLIPVKLNLFDVTHSLVTDLIASSVGSIAFESIRYLVGNQIASPIGNYLLETGVKALAAYTLAGPVFALTAVGSVTTTYVIRELRRRAKDKPNLQGRGRDFDPNLLVHKAKQVAGLEVLALDYVQISSNELLCEVVRCRLLLVEDSPGRCTLVNHLHVLKTNLV